MVMVVMVMMVLGEMVLGERGDEDTGNVAHHSLASLYHVGGQGRQQTMQRREGKPFS